MADPQNLTPRFCPSLHLVSSKTSQKDSAETVTPGYEKAKVQNSMIGYVIPGLLASESVPLLPPTSTTGLCVLLPF